jgi:hypothetical protein
LENKKKKIVKLKNSIWQLNQDDDGIKSKNYWTPSLRLHEICIFSEGV